VGLVTRANIGCGSIRPAGWANFEAEDWDIREPPPHMLDGAFSSAVMNHVLNHLDHHELVPALANVGEILEPGGTLRVMVPDLVEAFYAYQTRDRPWFPQDERIRGIDAAFCTYVTWFGTQKSVFTYGYLTDVLIDAGFRDVQRCRYQQTWSGDPKITELDDRKLESIFVEAVWP
jgi:predicted SAM-dependent methyltransferase